MKGKQQGMTLSSLLGYAIVIAIVALLGMKVGPEYYEHRQIVGAIKKVAAAAKPDASVKQIRDAFDRQANVDYISAIDSNQLDITKEGGRIVIAFAYEKRIPLVANVSLMLDFKGSTQE